jgi:hypothetical protein
MIVCVMREVESAGTVLSSPRVRLTTSTGEKSSRGRVRSAVCLRNGSEDCKKILRVVVSSVGEWNEFDGRV